VHGQNDIVVEMFDLAGDVVRELCATDSHTSKMFRFILRTARGWYTRIAVDVLYFHGHCSRAIHDDFRQT
jgi:hypothetical protein